MSASRSDVPAVRDLDQEDIVPWRCEKVSQVTPQFEVSWIGVIRAVLSPDKIEC